MTAAAADQTVEQGFRRARVGQKRLFPNVSEKQFACYMHTFHMGRWYYDGSNEYATEEEAIEFRDRWLNGGQA